MEEALRVRARMEKVEGDVEERRDSMQARPCLPVAPVMRRVLDIVWENLAGCLVGG